MQAKTLSLFSLDGKELMSLAKFCIFSKCLEILEYQQLCMCRCCKHCFLLMVCGATSVLVFDINLSLLQTHSVQCAFTGWGRAAHSATECVFTDNTPQVYHCSCAQVCKIAMRIYYKMFSVNVQNFKLVSLLFLFSAPVALNTCELYVEQVFF